MCPIILIITMTDMFLVVFIISSTKKVQFLPKLKVSEDKELSLLGCPD